MLKSRATTCFAAGPCSSLYASALLYDIQPNNMYNWRLSTVQQYAMAYAHQPVCMLIPVWAPLHWLHVQHCTVQGL